MCVLQNFYALTLAFVFTNFLTKAFVVEGKVRNYIVNNTVKSCRIFAFAC